VSRAKAADREVRPVSADRQISAQTEILLAEPL
jgi:hypothetical protein